MKVVRITSRVDLLKFQDEADARINVRFPLSFLKQSQVYGLFNWTGELVGGYVLAPIQQSRVVRSLPKKITGANRKLNKRLAKSFEFTGLWLDEDYRSGVYSVLFYLSLYRNVLKTGKRYFVYAYSSHKKGLGRLYSIVRKEQIYDGVTKILAGMTEAERECVELGSVYRLILAPMRYPTFLPKRLISTLRAS